MSSCKSTVRLAHVAPSQHFQCRLPCWPMFSCALWIQLNILELRSTAADLTIVSLLGRPLLSSCDAHSVASHGGQKVQSSSAMTQSRSLRGHFHLRNRKHEPAVQPLLVARHGRSPQPEDPSA